MVWDMGSYERYCIGCIGWIWAGGFGVLWVDFVLRLVGDLCDFVYVSWMMYYMILQGDFGMFLRHRGKFWDDGQKFSNGGEHLFYKMMFS